MNAAGSFGIATIVVGFHNQGKIGLILQFPELSGIGIPYPVIVSRSGYPSYFAQFLYRKGIELFPGFFLDKFKNTVRGIYFFRD